MQYQSPYPTETTGISRTSVLTRKRIRNHLRGNWQQDAEFFTRFFPVEGWILEISSHIKKKLYLESEKNPRWSGFPKTPKSVDSRVYTALNNLLNNILVFFLPPSHRFDKRLFVKTYRRGVLPNVKDPIIPGIILTGTDLALIASRSNRPIAHYSSTICPLEVIHEGADVELAQQRLATVIQQMFNHQPNRRFAFGLVISPRTLTCYLFDHSGVVISPSLDYHTHPDQLCALVEGLVVDNQMHTGLDISISNDAMANCRIKMGGPVLQDQTTPGPLYYLSCPLYHAPSIIGRGTTCFLVYQKDDPETSYVIKDAWISTDNPELEGRESEASLLLHAKSKGVVKGIAQISHWEDVQFTDKDGNFLIDNIHNIRRLAPSEYSLARQRVHTRMVLSTYGKPLEQFSSRKEFLLAYYDVVRAHRSLYETAGILHRDIKPGNILINSGGAERERGILIDLDRAIRIDNISPYSLKKQIGTHLFMSADALEGMKPQGYVDDLESFYYVLVYIVTMFTGPHCIKDKFPDPLDGWLSSAASSVKRGQLIPHSAHFAIEPWFGAVFKGLVHNLRSIFRTRLLNGVKKPPPTPAEPLEESDQFLSYISRAIIELNNEEVSQPSQNMMPQDADPPSGPQSTNRRHIGGPHTLAAKRSLRSNVNYGRPKTL